MKEDIVEIKSLSSEGDDDEDDQSDENSSENDNEAIDSNATLINPLALKPVFVSKIDREMLDPSI